MSKEKGKILILCVDRDNDIGLKAGGIKADRLIRDQLTNVLEKFQANNVILVTDGFGDAELIPIIQSRIPILSIKRVVVKHSEAIEENWALFSRYLRKLIEDPYYSRWFLGIPGVLLLALAVFLSLEDSESIKKFKH